MPRKINQYWKRLCLTLFVHCGDLNRNRQLLVFGIESTLFCIKPTRLFNSFGIRFIKVYKTFKLIKFV